MRHVASVPLCKSLSFSRDKQKVLIISQVQTFHGLLHITVTGCFRGVSLGNVWGR